MGATGVVGSHQGLSLSRDVNRTSRTRLETSSCLWRKRVRPHWQDSRSLPLGFYSSWYHSHSIPDLLTRAPGTIQGRGRGGGRSEARPSAGWPLGRRQDSLNLFQQMCSNSPSSLLTSSRPSLTRHRLQLIGCEQFITFSETMRPGMSFLSMNRDSV